MIGLFCVDPGEHSGIGWGIVDERSKTAAEAVANRIEDGHAMIVGDPLDQAKAIFRLWQDFKTRCVVNGCMDPNLVELIFEDFVLRGGQHAAGRSGTAPERIIWAFEGYRNGVHDTFRKARHLTPIIFQQPGQASTFKTRPRLEAAGAWIKGKDADHERTAMAHMILRVSTIMSRNIRR